MLRFATLKTSFRVGQQQPQRTIMSKLNVRVGESISAVVGWNNHNDKLNNNHNNNVPSFGTFHNPIGQGLRSFSSSTTTTTNNNNTSAALLNIAKCEEAPSQTTTTTTTATTTTNSFDDTMTKIFQDEKTSQALSNATDTTAATVGDAAPLVFDPTWWNFADQAIRAVNTIHEMTDLPVSLSIVGATCAIRVILLPLFVKSQQNTARMAHMQPEMQQLKAEMDKLGPNPDQQTQVKLGLQMRALFQKYDCNPMRALMLPLVQAPMFMGMFFGLRKMPDYFPTELAEGGILWFPDLTVTDPLYILPMGSALSFLLMIELGKEQMMASNPQQGLIMMNVFRGMSLMMIPVATTLSSAVLCYWVTNNSISLAQSMAFRNKSVRQVLNIWDPPKPVPGSPATKGIMESVNEMVDKVQGKAVTEQQQIQQHNEAVDSRKKANMIRTGRNRGSSSGSLQKKVGRRRKK
mmetsp:Transcript_26762/g.37615  ORF Transcript_26762/g.37615 Transcript_26762/m.37615 type:complete len:462 (+) Transcript_26762:272-1657(+)